MLELDRPRVNKESFSFTRADKERLLPMVGQLQSIPDNWWGKTRVVQTESGCKNRCAFCSQHAGTDVVRMDRNGVKNFVTALQIHLTGLYPERAAAGMPLLGFDRAQKPGVLYPYQDNDPGGSFVLDEFVEQTGKRLNTRVRLSTVGISRNNPELTRVHERLATELSEYVDGFRLSFTPYTYGWTKIDGRDASRADYIEDVAHTLSIYKPYIESRGTGRDVADVELRFKPNIYASKEQLREIEVVVGERKARVIQSGSYAFIFPGEKPLETAHLVGIEDKRPVYDNAGVNAIVIQSADLGNEGFPLTQLVEQVLQSERPLTDTLQLQYFNEAPIAIRRGKLYEMENVDGKYYVVDPAKKENGSYHAIQLYPQTESRKKSGVVNSTRYFLNALLDYRKQKGLDQPTQAFPNASWDDVEAVISLLNTQASDFDAVDATRANYIREEILPQVTAYATALIRSGLNPDYFFNLNFTKDTGIIVNHGRAHLFFKGLVSSPDVSFTANEQKSDFPNVDEGDTVRIYPAAYDISESQRGRLGGKNKTASKDTMVVTQVSALRFTPFGQTYEISGVDMTTTPFSDNGVFPLFPGAKSIAILH